MFLDLFVRVSEFARLRELPQTRMVAVQRFSIFLLHLSKAVDFVVNVSLWREVFTSFVYRCLVIFGPLPCFLKCRISRRPTGQRSEAAVIVIVFRL